MVMQFLELKGWGGGVAGKHLNITQDIE